MAKDYTISITLNGNDKASPVLKRFAGTAQKWLKRAEMAAIAAAIAFSTMSMKWGMDFEQQMSAVKAVSQATAVEMEALSGKVRQLGRDSAYSATQAGQAMEELLKAGISVTDTISAVESTLYLAAAGVLELAEAAAITAQAMNTFRLPATEAGHVADVLAQAAASAATDVHNIGEAMQYAGPVASALGVSLEDTVAVVSLMSKAGIDASMAGTTFRNIMTSLINPTDEARKAMEDLEITIVGADGKLLGITEILSQFGPEILESADGVAKLNKIFGERGAPGFIQLVREGAGNLVQFRDALKNADGAAKQMHDVRLDNLTGAFTLLKSSLEGVGIALVHGGEKSLAGSMKTYIRDAVIPVVNNMGIWIKQMGGLPGILTLTWTIIAAFATRIKNGFKSLMSWDIFTGFVEGMTVALMKMTESALTWLGNIAGAIIQIASVIWIPLAAPFVVVMDQLKELFVLFLNWIGPKVIDAFNWILEPLRPVLAKIGVEIGEFDWTPLTVEPAMSMQDAWKASWQVVGDKIDEQKTRVLNATDAMKTGFVAAGQEANDAFGLMGMGVEDFTKDIEAAIAKQKEMGAAGVAAADEVTKPIAALPPAVTDAIDKTNDELDKHDENVKQSAKNIEEAFTFGWQNYLDNIPGFLKSVEASVYHMGLTIERELSNSFGTFFRTGKISIHTFGKVISETGRTMLADLFAQEVMKKVVGGAVGYMVDLFLGDEEGDSGLAKIKKDLGGLWNWLKEQWTEGSIIAALGDAIGWLIGLFKGAFNWITGKDGSQKMWAGISAAPGTAWNTMRYVLFDTYISMLFQPFFSQVREKALGMWSGISAAPGTAWNTMRYVLFDTYISMLFQPFFSDIAAKAASMWTSVATPPGSIWQSLNTLLYNQLMNNYFIQFFNEVISGANNMWKSIYGSGKGVSTKINGVNYNMPGGGPTSPPITNPTPTPSGPPGSTYLPGYPKYESDTDMLKWKIDKIWDTLKDEYNLSAVELGTLQEMHDNYLYTYGNTDSGPISFNVNDIPGKSDQQKLIDWLVTKGYWDYLNTNPGAAYHTGGMISNEGLFLGLSGEGVLNRMAMSNIGSEGLRRLNAGGSVGNTMYITIQAWDGEDVERVFENRIIPMLKRTSEAGVEVIHESGIRYAMR